jgi:hypothetical protein
VQPRRHRLVDDRRQDRPGRPLAHQRDDHRNAEIADVGDRRGQAVERRPRNCAPNTRRAASVTPASVASPATA